MNYEEAESCHTCLYASGHHERAASRQSGPAVRCLEVMSRPFDLRMCRSPSDFEVVQGCLIRAVCGC